MKKKLFILILMFVSVISFTSVTFKGITPFLGNSDYILSNNKIVASFTKEGVLENLAQKDVMYDAIDNLYYALDKKRVYFNNSQILNDKLIAFGTNGDKSVKAEYSLISNGLHVKITTDSTSQELRVFFKDSDVNPVIFKGKNYHFVQGSHVAYAISFPNSMSMYRIGALMILNRTPKIDNGKFSFEFDILVDKDVFSLKKDLELVKDTFNMKVVDERGRPINDLKVVALNNYIPLDVSTTSKDGELVFSLPQGNYKYQILNLDLEIKDVEDGKIIINLPENLGFKWKPYLTDLSTNSVYVAFRTNKPSTALVLFDHSKVIDNLYDTFHMIKLDNLKPMTTYAATVIVGNSLIDNVYFKTAGQERYKFLVYGDTRTNNDWHKVVCDEMAKENALFVLHTGDLVESGIVPIDWDRFFDAVHDLYSTTPLFPTLGNHEHNSILYYQAFMTAEGGGDFHKQWYSFDIGPVHYIFLDSDVEQNTVEDSIQTEWLENDLKNTNKPYIVVLFHHPFFSNVKNRGQQFRPTWHDLFVKYKVSVVFNGHIHHYERFYKDGIMYVTTGGGGAPLGFGLYSSDVSFLPFSKAAYAGYLHYIIGNIEDDHIQFIVKAVGKQENNKLKKVNQILDEFIVTPRK
ncbi:putative phosphodiesterase [Thermosipho japonicus]|uniref:Putative phosphodiesterase n=1 Tax=Thermosipho japonicus TaxID=90323 RepID=A0A841GJL7_9BACT|nr:metallophosphoesterase [Thermosipho japonicus]MBB6062547.1 putative phosphodiesterase [Thermosipho japonicus]